MQNFLNLNKKINFLKTHNAMCTINGHAFTNLTNTIGGIYIVRDPRDVLLSYANHFQVDMKQLKNLRWIQKMVNIKMMDLMVYHRSFGNWSR